MFRHFIYAIHISAMFKETIGVWTHDLCHQNGAICLSYGYQPRAKFMMSKREDSSPGAAHEWPSAGRGRCPA
jgi:hypothetical protein